MPVRVATASDLQGWADLRALLWPDTPLHLHLDEAATWLSGSPGRSIAFLAGDASAPCAFAEAGLRHDHVNGCETSPVAFLEGIYVRPEARGHGIGRQLLGAVQAWAIERGCTELASDAHLRNVASHAFHAALGFHETERVVFFRKPL